MMTTAQYWERRYSQNGNSGDGSYGKYCQFKAQVVNAFIQQHSITSVIDMGCGDGNQASALKVPRYLGIDISPSALAVCRKRFEASGKDRVFSHDRHSMQAELTLSMDVIYHLIEDTVFAAYMADLFDAALRFVIVYSSNQEEQFQVQARHIRHRKFSTWIEQHRPQWKLREFIANIYPWDPVTCTGTYSDFYIYAKL